MIFQQLKRYDGNQALFNLVKMSIAATLAGDSLHIHAEGLRGTGKTTILRSARDIMPPITRIQGCLYNCDPRQPHCPLHRHMSPEEIQAIGTEEIAMPFLEISHSAKIGTVVGSIDIAKLTAESHAEACLLPGIIPQAHRGIIFIDEINRLADMSPEITDVLLDVMGGKPGHIQIEEAGLEAVDLPVNVSVWAASNPDEDPGPLEEIRRQLSDRFDVLCFMGRPDTEQTIVDILQENLFSQRQIQNSDLPSYRSDMADKKEMQEWAERYKHLPLPAFIQSYIARIYLKYNIESIRAIESMQQCTLLYAVTKNHQEPLLTDLFYVLPYTLRHRVLPEDLETITSEIELKDNRSNFLNLLQPGKGKPDTGAEEYFKNNGTLLSKQSRDSLIHVERPRDK